ncbi:MAG: YraN family protein, partial [Bacteroidota bacterium]|nr:YraN family protein [Bacteroidota bacterium]
MAKHNLTGSEGEVLAKNYLEKAGYSIVYLNYRHKKAEIDIIAEKDKLLIFVEVKTRSGNNYGEPEAFVSKKKSNLIIDAADYFIHKKDWLYDIRIDIISI